MATVVERPITPVQKSIQVEVTGKCPLNCEHCFAASGPQGTHGTMNFDQWCKVISDAAALGIPHVQLIGGEPTFHPRWVDLVEHALSLRLRVEVYSNLFHVRPEWWDALAGDGVSLATSYYSDHANEHDKITTRVGSHRRTRDNIEEAVLRGIPVRAGIVHVLEGQRVEPAREELKALGVTHVRVDRVRAIGRAATEATPDTSELCGRCGTGQVAVLPDGQVVPCAMSRFLPCGTVQERPIADILGSAEWRSALESIPARAENPCDPDCLPALDGGDCAPAEQEACDPAYADIGDGDEK
ncbi:radical SAM protein [Streptomyces olivoreticuli]